jgi:hypothetical protein
MKAMEENVIVSAEIQEAAKLPCSNLIPVGTEETRDAYEKEFRLFNRRMEDKGITNGINEDLLVLRGF